MFCPSQPPSRNRRERAELRPDFFDSAAMIEDESVSRGSVGGMGGGGTLYVSILEMFQMTP